MRHTLTLVTCFTLFLFPSFSADLFGTTPKSQEAKALKEEIAKTQKSQGTAKAIRLLEEKGRAFLNESNATAQYDFFSELRSEAQSNGGPEHQEWCLALTQWCYQYCIKDGEGYWLTVWTPLMHEKYFEAGKYGSARAVIDHEIARLMEFGYLLDVDSMKTIRPANPEFPAFGVKSLGRNAISTKMYDFFLSRAKQDMVEGRWKRAMESFTLAAENTLGTSRWYGKYPDLKDSKLNVRDCTMKWRVAQWWLSEGYSFLDLPEEELKTLQELGKYQLNEEWFYNFVQYGNCRALQLEVILGRKGAEVIDEINKISQEMFANKSKNVDDLISLSLFVADIHFRTGNEASGWDLIDKARAEKDVTQDSRYRINSEWCRHSVAAGRTEGVEAVLVDLLKVAREGGLKQREIQLYETYARLLIVLGRFEDALFIQQELIRLLRSFDVTPRIPGALHQLAEIYALMGQKALAERNVHEAKQRLAEGKFPEAFKTRIRKTLDKPLPNPKQPHVAEGGCDLQPMRSMMIPLEGLPSRGLFTLTNYSGTEQTGELHLVGEGLTFRDDSSQHSLGVDVSTPTGSTEIRRKVNIAAGDFLVIDLSRQMSPEAKRSTVAINWTPSAGESQAAEWVGDTVEEGVSLAVTDAGEYLDNPFYMIPMYHLLQYTDSFAQVADLRVVASKPTRIELYDQNDELVFVDADGDGAFSSDGDIVSKDLNRNQIGDVALEKSAKESRFRLFVRPKELIPGSEISLDLQLYKQGQWVSYATDRILFPKGEK